MRVNLFEPFTEVDLSLPDRRDGKVRSSWALDDARRLIVTTDRLSAFDRILAGVPYKGQVLNQLAAWWFEQTADVIDHHVLDVPDPNALVARAAAPLSVEVVVRGYITGVTDTSIWGMYADGARTIYGYEFPDGLEKNTPLPRHIVTPTTKAQDGGHDVPLTCAEVVEHGHLDYLSRDEDLGLCLQIHSCDDGTSSFPLGGTPTPVPTGDLNLRMIFDNSALQFSWSTDGTEFHTIGPILDASLLSDDYGDHWGFTGTFVALACQDLTGSKLAAEFEFLELLT